MNAHNLKIWALIQSLLVRAEGFKATNQYSVVMGYKPRYTESAFGHIESEIDRLANSFVNHQPGDSE